MTIRKAVGFGALVPTVIQRIRYPNRSRLSLYNLARPRSFHTTPCRPVYHEILVQTHALIEGLHSFSGLPWSATIPLTAIVARTVFNLPAEIYSRKNHNKMFSLAPQIEDGKPAIARLVAKRFAGKPASYKEAATQHGVWQLREWLYKQNGIRSWKIFIVFLDTPVLLVPVEILRRMSGSRENLFDLIRVSLTGGIKDDPTVIDNDIIPMDPSLAFEGLVWFPNLLLPDASHILSFLLAATMLYRWSWRRVGVPLPGTSSRAMNMLQTHNRVRYWIGIGLMIAAAPATMQFPSVMLYYWICHNVVGSFQSRLLSKWQPVIAPDFEVYPPSGRAKKQQYRGPKMKDLQNRKKQT